MRGVNFVFPEPQVVESCESQPALVLWERVSSPFTAQKCGEMFKEKKKSKQTSIKIKAKLLLIFNVIVFEAGL